MGLWGPPREKAVCGGVGRACHQCGLCCGLCTCVFLCESISAVDIY